ncbi:MAG: NAD(P)H-binding protein [Chloroherpetonaceae bacterium]|nr:NAD(P)H-binding protein [Chloroherpetonaceae bacterium]
MKQVTLIGATGLIGGHLLTELLQHPSIEAVRVIARRPLERTHPKLEVRVIDFSDLVQFKSAIEGSSAVFVAVGTTSNKVKGDEAEYRKVDYDIPVNAARFCNELGCPHFSLVSSTGSDSKSFNFYARLKGEVEDAVKAFPISSISIFRPSLLLGERKEFRLGERISEAVMSPFSFLIPNQYKAIQASAVAKAMLAAALQLKPGVNVYHYEEIMALAKSV